MKQRVFVALLTVVVFVAGYAARVWTEHDRPVPPPPASLTEYARPAPQPDSQVTTKHDRAKLVAEIEKWKQQIQAYRTRVDEIYTEFNREFALVLNDEQRQKFEANQKKWAERDAKRLSDPEPLTDEDIDNLRKWPLTDVYWMVTVTPRLEQVTKDYKLDEEQQSKVRSLLALRRNKFIALLDSTPHPSIRLSRLAPLVERVAAPAK